MKLFELFKSQCVLCDMSIDSNISLCEGCRKDLPMVEFACSICALPLKESNKSNFCGKCINQTSYVDYAINLFHYAVPIDYLIGQMKFHQELTVVAVLADLLKNHIEAFNSVHGLPDVFLPVPLYKTRLVERGFNQALEIIKPLAKSQHIPVILDVISRSKETKTQTNLNKLERKKNLAGSFTMLKKLAYSHVVIVDDVVTTGATTQELAKLLKNSGVKTVGVLSLARADLN